MFGTDSWTCPACGFTPEPLGGFQCFAPELARDNSDYDPKHFRTLVALEDDSFWFQARNRIILWSLSRFFPAVSSLLEIGVGTGFVMRELRRSFPQVRMSASDIYIEGLQCAAERIAGSVELLQMDARQVPFRSEFDVVCLFDVLEHIQDDEAVLKELSYVLKPGGGLLLTVPQHMFLWGPFDEAGFHKRRYGVRELERKVKAAGFDVVVKSSFISFLLPVLYVSRLRSRWRGEYDIHEEQNIHPAVDWVFRKLLSMEFRLIQAGLRLPMGGSQLLIARLRADAQKDPNSTENLPRQMEK
jgi:ubiquinone/menaquinone biosynthesis C-methylase UbiE